MDFFDCKIIYGIPAFTQPLMPVPDIYFVQKEMALSGIAKALVYREEQLAGGVVLGNKLVAEDVKNTNNLWGIWFIIPHYTHEIPDPVEMLIEMKKKRIAAWQVAPEMHGFTFCPLTLAPWFELAQSARIPIFFKLGNCPQIGNYIDEKDLYSVLDKYPELVCIISPPSVWPSDRIIRPLVKEFPNVHVELSEYITDGGIEELVHFCGPQKILFGSNFYKCHFGGVMLMLKHSQISETDKQLIASKNIERLIGDIRYDS